MQLRIIDKGAYEVCAALLDTDTEWLGEDRGGYWATSSAPSATNGNRKGGGSDIDNM